jgi:periplasmic protein CpxP/Spy
MANRVFTLALAGALMLGASAAIAQDNPPQPQDTPQGQNPDQAQGPQGRGPGRMDPDRQLQHMTRALNLTADQQNQIKPLLVERQQKMEAIFQDQSLARPDRRAKMQALRADTNSKIEAVLNGDQKQKYEEMQQHTRRRGRGGEGAPPPPPDGAAPQPQ